MGLFAPDAYRAFFIGFSATAIAMTINLLPQLGLA